MKAYGIVAILSLVLLTAAGYTITAWQHLTLEDAHEADHSEDETGTHAEDTNSADTHGDGDTSETIASSTSGTGQTSTSSNDDDHATTENTSTQESTPTSGGQTEDTTSTTAGNTTETSSTNETTSSGTTASGTTSTDNTEDTTTTSTSTSDTDAATATTTTTAETMPEALEVTLGVQTERVEDSTTPLVTIQLKVMGADLNLDGWRLGDAIGVAGHPDHLFYFGDVELADGDTLTIHSSCGRDDGLTMYWCLSQPLSLLDSGRRELFLLDGHDDVALTCRPVSDEQTSSMDYECI